MFKQFKICIILTLFFGLVYSQVSVSDINSLNDVQIEALKSKLGATSVSDEIVNSNNKITNTDINVDTEKVSIISEKGNISKDSYFGYSYFKKEINFFDNIPTPNDYTLGPGDSIILTLWGETNIRQEFIINKDGSVFFDSIGFINLSNNSIPEAEKLVKRELSKVYSTLESSETYLSISLKNLKSINVYFSGQINSPGINLIHPFSDVFSAIIQAKGVNYNGSLRNVQLIRSEEILETIDFYKFFTTGMKSFSKIKILDGDVIHIPPVHNRVHLKGEVKTPGIFELKSGETIEDLINYSGGFSEKASTSAILSKTIPLKDRKSDDFAQSSMNININDFDKIILNNSDGVNVLSIPNVDSFVEVIGRVKNPGLYSSSSNLKDVLDLAGGFYDPQFRRSIKEDQIIILRKDESMEYSKVLNSSYSDSENLILNPEDKIFVYEVKDFNNSTTFSIFGEVKYPGTYPFSNNSITIEQAIKKVGGFTNLGSFNNLKVEMDGKIINNIKKDSLIRPNYVINIIKDDQSFMVLGNVYNEGKIAINSKNISMHKAIKLAGGLKPYTLKNRIYLQRANGEVINPRMLNGRGIRVNSGDKIYVPKDPNPQDFNITEFISDFSSTLANIAAILILIDRN